MLNLSSLAARQPPTTLLQSALTEGRLMDAADLLAEWAQRQHASAQLNMEQQAHLLHSCYELLQRQPHTDVWVQSRTYLQQLAPRS